MSQSPYQPPMSPNDPYGVAAPDLRRPARWAGLLMMILGGLFLVLGGIVMCVGSQFDKYPELLANLPPELVEASQQTGGSIGLIMTVGGAFVAIPGIAMLILGPFVRRGGTTAVVLGIIVTALVLLYLVVQLIGSVMLLVRGNPAGVNNICMMTVPAALLVLQTVWLVKALMNVGPLKAFNAEHQEYQWQLAQQARAQQQAYQQGYPPPPPPPGQGPDQPGQG